MRNQTISGWCQNVSVTMPSPNWHVIIFFFRRNDVNNLKCHFINFIVIICSPLFYWSLSAANSNHLHEQKWQCVHSLIDTVWFGLSDPLNVNVIMMELSFQGISAALPSSDAMSIRAEWLSVSSCWEVYGRAEDPAHLQEEGKLNSFNTAWTWLRIKRPTCIFTALQIKRRKKR